MQNEIELKAEIPAAFAAACQMAEITPEKALQTFLDRLIFYTQLASPGDDPHSLAGIVLREFLDSRGMIPAPNPLTRVVNIQYTQQVLDMMRTKMSTSKREKQYGQIVDNWYRDLQLIPGPGPG
jgi:hypothetical protein